MTLPSEAKYAGIKWSATIVLHSLTLPYASCSNDAVLQM